jgi:hypothetical protein
LSFFTSLVAWDGIEPSTRGFSMRFRASRCSEANRKSVKNHMLSRNQPQSGAITFCQQCQKSVRRSPAQIIAIASYFRAYAGIFPLTKALGTHSSPVHTPIRESQTHYEVHQCRSFQLPSTHCRSHHFWASMSYVSALPCRSGPSKTWSRRAVFPHRSAWANMSFGRRLPFASGRNGCSLPKKTGVRTRPRLANGFLGLNSKRSVRQLSLNCTPQPLRKRPVWHRGRDAEARLTHCHLSIGAE